MAGRGYMRRSSSEHGALGNPWTRHNATGPCCPQLQTRYSEAQGSELLRDGGRSTTPTLRRQRSQRPRALLVPAEGSCTRLCRHYRGGAVTPPTPCRWRSDVAGGGGGGGDGRESGSGSSSGCAAPDVGCSRCRRRSGRCSGPRPLAPGAVGTFPGGRRRTQRPGARPGPPGLRSLR